MLIKIKKTLNITLALMIVLVLFQFASLVNSSESSVKSKETTETENTEYDVSMFKQIDVDGLKEAFDSEEAKVVYLGRATCGYCVQFLPVIQKAQDEFGYKTLYIDITTIDEDGAKEIQGMDSFLEENYGTTPLVIIVKDGKLVKGHVGYAEYDEFAKYLTDNGIEK